MQATKTLMGATAIPVTVTVKPEYNVASTVDAVHDLARLRRKRADHIAILGRPDLDAPLRVAHQQVINDVDSLISEKVSSISAYIA
jgi:hypothetical protein